MKVQNQTSVGVIPTEKIIEWRRHLHQNPELSFHETNTGNYVESILKSFGTIEVLRPAKNSVVGILKGNLPGKKVGFRADMDALPIQEETDLAFASQNKGISHACGHDAHTAMLLGTASVLSKMQDQIKGTIVFIFQHAEEFHPGGAIDVVRSGVLDGIDAIFGMHVMPGLPVGHIGILPIGAASTSSDMFNLTIQGKGSHGSMPHLSIDPIVIGSSLVMNLQSIISRNVAPDRMAVLSIGKFQSGDAYNVIPNQAELAASIRTVDQETRELIENNVRKMVEHTVSQFGGTYDLEYINSYPFVNNNAELNQLARESAEKILGKDKVLDVPMMTASEDFAYYHQVAPINFMLLGTGEGEAPHHPKFNINEAAFENGSKTSIQILLDFLNKE